MAPDFEVTGDDGAIAAIIAWAAGDEDKRAGGRGKLSQPVGSASARVFHQDQGRQAVLVGRDAVDGANLFTAERA